ncbi:hypothetical protein BP6252_08766 [Coleophoma cylindrospora]|uniref:LYC1 C-terminal domain-containing protein n=1 Tax=Coleophoma cylindrospora TaxID=1849047 RepID=A0A3D8R6Y8_9HELO|nr:hypothetical protein BP6252_08766 [Coleophoma cylindrospora]
MGSIDLPDWQSPSLALVNPTFEEQIQVWSANSAAWKGPLTKEVYIEREKYLTTVPLNCEKGITHWILVDSTLPPDQRQILASCESLRKRAFVAQGGAVKEVITHGIGSVFCNPKYRGRKYASRMMAEVRKVLKTWQTEERDCKFSILYSDIGKSFYAGFGFKPFPSTHIALPPSSDSVIGEAVKPLQASDLPALCAWDEASIKSQLAAAKDGKIHVAIIPENDQMQWFHLREEFLCKNIFGSSKSLPTVKGALAGMPGSRVWAVWTRSYYGPLVHESGNTLHILRLVIEDESAEESNSQALKEILGFAQREAKEWVLNEVELWNPTPGLKKLVDLTGLEHSEVVRDKESIASLMWYGEEKEEVVWVGNEKFGWC